MVVEPNSVEAEEVENRRLAIVAEDTDDSVEIVEEEEAPDRMLVDSDTDDSMDEIANNNVDSVEDSWC